MSGTQPVAVYAAKIPTGDVMVPAVADFAAMFRLSMAAIDPTAEPEADENGNKQKPRSTLKLVRVPGDMLADDDSDDNEIDSDEEGDEDSSEDEEMNGGPSDPSKAKKERKVNGLSAIAGKDGKDGEDEDEDSDMDEEAAKAALKRLAKGKGKATGGAADDEEDEDEDDDDSDSGLELEEVVVCTLDADKNYQQPLDIVVGEDEKVFFKVSGSHEIHLTGNYVIPMDDSEGRPGMDEDDEDDYDLSPDELDEDELAELNKMVDGDESDELDEMDDPRITEVDTDEEAPKLVKDSGKGKKKRPAEDSDHEDQKVEEAVAKSNKAAEPMVNGDEKPLSKSQKKKLKKLKKNDGEAVEVEAHSTAAKVDGKAGEGGKTANMPNGEKKVQFAKDLEQGPTTTTTTTKNGDSTKSHSGSGGGSGIKTVQGVTIDDRKLGSGPQAKKGNQVEMRYYGKLEDGQVFDANKRGKPFSFKVGAGQVIKGWDIGVAGMAVGGERRLTIPANLAYGSKGAPPKIPANATLKFDLKMLSIK